jgi:hypothetical protein
MKVRFVGLIFLVATLVVHLAPADAQTSVNCAKGQTITAALASGATDIVVIGTCTESPSVTRSNVTIEGNPAVSTGGAVVGDIFIGGAQNVTIKKLTVTGANYGIEVGFGSAATISNTTVQKAKLEGISVYSGGSARLDHVTVQNNALGIDAFNKGEVRVLDGSLVQNNTGIGILISLGSAGYITDSTIKNNQDNGPGGGITVSTGSAANLDHNVISGNHLFGVLVVIGSSAVLTRNTITATSSTDVAVDVERNSTGQFSGGNTFRNTIVGGQALVINYSSSIVQQFGHDIILGYFNVYDGSTADFNDDEIRSAKTFIGERSIVNFFNFSANPLNVALTGNTSISQGATLQFLKLSNSNKVNVAGNITCFDVESKLAGTQFANISGNTTTCSQF